MSDTTQFEIARESRSNPAGSVPGVVLIGLGLMNAVLACALCWLQPQHTPAWALAGLVLPIALLVVRLLPSSGNAARRSLSWTLLGTGLLVTLPLMLRLFESEGLLEYITMRRILGASLGGALVVVGSMLPQRIAPLAWSRFGALLAAKLARLLGVAVVAAGVAYALIWALAPLTLANVAASTVTAAIAVVAGLRALLIAKNHSH